MTTCGTQGDAEDVGLVEHAQTVPRWLVHRTAVSEVLLTSWRRLGDDSFILGAQWPRTHSFYARPGAGVHDPLLAAETIRQAGVLLAHAAYDVPLGHQFLMGSLGYDVDLARMAVGPQPADLQVLVTCTGVRRRRESLASMGLEVRIVGGGGEPVGCGSGQLTVIDPRTYARLRQLPRQSSAGSTALQPPVPAATVGRDRDADVVLAAGPTPSTWWLRADRRHPVLFDHPLDHVPGMLLVEAARQAAQTLTDSPVHPERLRAEFFRYVELDAPCLVSVRAPSGTDVAAEGAGLVVTFEQDGDVAVRAVLRSSAGPEQITR